MPNNIIVGKNMKTALVSAAISTLDLSGITVIYGASDAGNPNSYTPGYAINSLTNIVAGNSYEIRSTVAKDMTSTFGNPLSTKWEEKAW